MTFPNPTVSATTVQQQIFDAAKAQLTAVRDAVEATNRVVFDATDEYLSILAKDAVLFDQNKSALEDISARSTERANALAGLQDTVVQGVAKAWQPITDKLVSDGAALVAPEEASPVVPATQVVTAPPAKATQARA